MARPDPSLQPCPCEAPGCTVTLPLGKMHSIAAVYRMPGLTEQGYKYGAYQCAEEQHFGCCHEHALLAMLVCVFTHIEEGEHNHPKQETYIDQDLEQVAQRLLAKTSCTGGIVDAADTQKSPELTAPPQPGLRVMPEHTISA